MALLHMQRIYLCALKKDRKSLLEFLQRRGVVEISDKIPEDHVFRKTDVSVTDNILKENIKTSEEALEILKPHLTDDSTFLEGLLGGRKNITPEDYNEFSEKYDQVVKISNRVITLSREIAETKAEISKLNTQINMLEPWVDFTLPMNYKGTRHTKSFIGTLPYEWTLEDVYAELADLMPVHVEIVSVSKEQTCIFVLCENEKADQVNTILRRNGFAYPSLSFSRSPQEQMDYLTKEVQDKEAALKQVEKEIITYAKHKNDLLFLQDYEQLRKDKYLVIGRLLQTKHVFMFTGYIPENEVEDLSRELEANYTIAIEVSDPEENEDVPVEFKNNKFSEPLESTVTGFSPPGKGEADPTMVMSLFYYLLFGMMLSDAGYGAILAIACGFGLVKFKGRLEKSMEKVLRMYFYCGLATIFWGIMFGSYFGDLIDIVGAKFFNVSITIPPLWFTPMDEPMRMLAFAMLVGIIHLFAGLGMNAYQMYLQKDYKGMMFDVGLWYIMLTSIVVFLLSMDMITGILGLTLQVPAIIAQIAKISAIASAVGIILTNGRESRNPVKRVLKGAYALYGVSGYLGDVLSYSRLLALGLTTGVICTVINQMADMLGTGFISVIFFIIIIVLGHLMNLAINALGSYVHTSRLQYVEFFGKFYEGGGRVFKPFGVNTKYYKFKEKMNNG